MSKQNSGLTDREQALITLLSTILIAVGVITVPADFPYAAYLGIALTFAGAVGLALKEWAGSAISTGQATLEGLAASIAALTQLQQAKQNPQPTQQPIDKTKLLEEIMTMATEAIEKATSATPTGAS